MQFCIANKLSFTAIGELLKLLAILFPSESLLPRSFYKFKKFFQKFNPIHSHNQICTKCQKSTDDTCSCEDRTTENKAHIVHLEVKKPLEKIISGKLIYIVYSIHVHVHVQCMHYHVISVYLCTDNWESLQIPSQSSTSSETLQDVWDGSALRPLCSRGRFFSSADNLALSLSTDGVPVYKSSPVSIWPVYLIILNLPAHIRMNSENVILCGLWLGPTKPIINLLLNPVAKLLNKRSTLGMRVKTSLANLTVRARLVMGVFDLPAKQLYSVPSNTTESTAALYVYTLERG